METQTVGFATFLTQTDSVGRTILVVLLLMSIVTWSLIMMRSIQILIVRRRTARFLETFWSAPSLQAVALPQPAAHVGAVLNRYSSSYESNMVSDSLGNRRERGHRACCGGCHRRLPLLPERDPARAQSQRDHRHAKSRVPAHACRTPCAHSGCSSGKARGLAHGISSARPCGAGGVCCKTGRCRRSRCPAQRSAVRESLYGRTAARAARGRVLSACHGDASLARSGRGRQARGGRMHDCARRDVSLGLVSALATASARLARVAHVRLDAPRPRVSARSACHHGNLGSDSLSRDGTYGSPLVLRLVPRRAVCAHRGAAAGSLRRHSAGTFGKARRVQARRARRRCGRPRPTRRSRISPPCGARSSAPRARTRAQRCVCRADRGNRCRSRISTPIPRTIAPSTAWCSTHAAARC